MHTEFVQKTIDENHIELFEGTGSYAAYQRAVKETHLYSYFTIHVNEVFTKRAGKDITFNWWSDIQVVLDTLIGARPSIAGPVSFYGRRKRLDNKGNEAWGICLILDTTHPDFGALWEKSSRMFRKLINPDDDPIGVMPPLYNQPVQLPPDYYATAMPLTTTSTVKLSIGTQPTYATHSTNTTLTTKTAQFGNPALPQFAPQYLLDKPLIDKPFISEPLIIVLNDIHPHFILMGITHHVKVDMVIDKPHETVDKVYDTTLRFVTGISLGSTHVLVRKKPSQYLFIDSLIGIAKHLKLKVVVFNIFAETPDDYEGGDLDLYNTHINNLIPGETITYKKKYGSYAYSYEKDGECHQFDSAEELVNSQIFLAQITKLWSCHV